ncbi:MAG: hypothetical protein ACTSYE_02780 [Alphaproteobacteria bacterium]
MNVWIHSAIVATIVAATVAVGIASASSAFRPHDDINAVAKSDRLPFQLSSQSHVTIETRGERVSMLLRMPVN